MPTLGSICVATQCVCGVDLARFCALGCLNLPACSPIICEAWLRPETASLETVAACTAGLIVVLAPVATAEPSSKWVFFGRGLRDVHGTSYLLVLVRGRYITCTDRRNSFKKMAMTIINKGRTAITTTIIVYHNNNNSNNDHCSSINNNIQTESQ